MPFKVTELIASNLLGSKFPKYAEMDSAERHKIWEPMFNNVYHVTAFISNRSCTIIDMVKVDYTRNVRARYD